MPTPGLLISEEKARSEWEQHSVADRDEMEFVTHTAHVETALRILEDRVIRAGLVYDESRLKPYRTVVVWVSPNEWYQGSRYGNIAFKMPFADLRERFPKAYWVETATYAVVAPRILFSKRESSRLVPYDPEIDDGPWTHSGRHGHSRNGEVCLEILIVGDLKLNLVEEIKFFDHHISFCSERKSKGRPCDNLGVRKGEAGAQFMCGVIGRNLSLAGIPVERRSTHEAWDWLSNKLRRFETEGENRRSRSTRRALLKSLLNLIYTKNNAGAAAIASLFGSSDMLVETAREILKEQFEHVPATDD